MNRLMLYLDGEEPQMPEGDYWVVETDSSYLIVSADTARAIERQLARRFWRPRWIAFHDRTGGRRYLRTNVIECVYESTATQRASRREFERARRQEEKADRRPWEDD